jgi:hypothetical protein
VSDDDSALARIVHVVAAAVTPVGFVVISGYVQVLGDANLLGGTVLVFGGLYATSDALVRYLTVAALLLGVALAMVVLVLDPAWYSGLGVMGSFATAATRDPWTGETPGPATLRAVRDGAPGDG